jgi:hypothetical protein
MIDTIDKIAQSEGTYKEVRRKCEDSRCGFPLCSSLLVPAPLLRLSCLAPFLHLCWCLVCFESALLLYSLVIARALLALRYIWVR